MANLSDQKTLQNKFAVMGPTVVHTDTISDLDPAVYEGAFAYSSDKKMYFSNGSNWRTTEDPPIKTPSAASTTSDSTTQRQLTLSKFLNSSTATQYKQIGIIFEISFSPSMKNPIMQKTIETVVRDIEGNITAYLPINKYNLFATDTLPNLKPGDVFYWRGKYVATDGQESGFSKPYAQTFPAFIDTPKAATDSNETTHLISVNEYHSPFNLVNQLPVYPPYQIQWLLSTDAEFKTSLSATSDIKSGNPLNTIKLFPTPGTEYYWKARYISTVGSGRKVSEYSFPAKSIQVRDVGTPKIIDVKGATGKTVRLKVTEYSSLTSTARLKTEWSIATSSTDLDNNSGTVFTSAADTPDILDIVTLPATIKADGNTIYYWKAYYTNSLGVVSEPSPAGTFIRYPEIVSPTALTVLNAETKTLVVSDFSSEYSTIYPYSKTEWRVYDAITNNLVYSEDTASNSTLDIFAHANVILPDGKYTWTVRYKNSRGTYSALISSSNYQIPWIYAPVPITTANNTTDQDSLVASTFSTEYGASPVYSEITITALDGTILEIIPNNPSPDKINIYSGLRGYSTKLQQGNTYNWKIKYIGALNGLHQSRYSITSTYTQPLFIITPSITVPISTDPTGRLEGPTLTLIASQFTLHSTVNSISDEHVSSDWQLSTTRTFAGWDDVGPGKNRTITARVDKNTTFTDTWTITNLEPATTYFARVRYYGSRGYSDWSQPIEFSTLFEYKHFVKLPTNYTPNPVIGQGYAGGFFAGTMWQNITNSLTSYAPAAIIVGNTVSFEVPSMQYNRIVYLNQIVQLRSTNSPRYIQITGKVRGASATTLKVLITGIFLHDSISSTLNVSDWSIMAKFHTIISPKSSAGSTKQVLRDNDIQSKENGWLNFLLKNVDRTVLPKDQYLLDITSNTSTATLTWPEEFFNLCDGQAIQTAMWRFSWLFYAWFCTTNTTVSSRGYEKPEVQFPLAHYVYNLNVGGGINTYSDWYAPSRDELQLCFYNLTPTDLGSGNSTIFNLYRYNPASYGVTSVSSTYARVNSYISIRGNISDRYPTLLNTPTTLFLAPDNDFGSNNNSEPYETQYYYTEVNTYNADTVTPYLKATTAASKYYNFARSTNPLFAFNGAEALNGSYYNPSSGITSPINYLISSTCIKIGSAYEYNNSYSSIYDSNYGGYYKHPPYTLNVDTGNIFGKTVAIYGYSTSPFTRLIRRQLA